MRWTEFPYAVRLAVPTLLSSSRVVFALAFPFASGPVRLGLLIAGAVSDGLDGLAARRGQVTTRWGSVLDAWTDKALAITALATLLAEGVVPWWWLLPLLARDAAVVGLGAMIAARHGVRSVGDIEHLFTGKLTTAAGFALLLGLVGLPGWSATHLGLFAVAGAASLVAAADYLWRYRSLCRGEVQPHYV